MKLWKSIGEGTALGSIIVLIVFFVLLSYNGLMYGTYRIVLDSNTLHEHWIEFIFVVIGFIAYIHTRKIKIRVKLKVDGNVK